MSKQAAMAVPREVAPEPDLVAFLDIARSGLGDGVASVSGIRRLTGGASRETWAFDARHADGRTVPLILQVERPGALNGGGTMPLEAAAQRAARGVGVPAPLVLAEGDGPPLDRPFLLLERIEGETIPRRIMREDRFAAVREDFARECGQLLALVHSIPRDSVPGLDAGDVKAQFADKLHRLPVPYPALELGLRWLNRNPLPAGEQVILHGDFRNGNLLVSEERIEGVLDWEFCHVGDPAEDLAWLCLKAWRFGSPLPVGGMGTREDLFEAYESASGREVDPARVRWWEVFNNVKWAVICALQARAHLDGHVRSLELLSLGRRVSEIELELLRLLP